MQGCEYSSGMNIRELEHTTRIVRFFFLEVRLGHPDLFFAAFEQKRVFESVVGRFHFALEVIEHGVRGELR